MSPVLVPWPLSVSHWGKGSHAQQGMRVVMYLITMFQSTMNRIYNGGIQYRLYHLGLRKSTLIFVQWQSRLTMPFSEYIPAVQWCMTVFPWPLIVSGVPDEFSLAGATRLTWYCQQDTHSISGKKWACLHHILIGWESGPGSPFAVRWMLFLHYWGPWTTPPSLLFPSFRILLWLPHALFLEFLAVLNTEKQGELKLIIHAEYIKQCIVYVGKVQ